MSIQPTNLLNGADVAWFGDGIMTGVEKRVSEVCQLDGIVSDVSWDAAWTDDTTVLGDFGVDFRNDDSSEWIPGVEGTDFDIIGPAVSSNSANVLVHCRARSGQARCTYTNVSGTGQLDKLFAQGKRR